jgi:hypothetical protein
MRSHSRSRSGAAITRIAILNVRSVLHDRQHDADQEGSLTMSQPVAAPARRQGR